MFHSHPLFLPLYPTCTITLQKNHYKTRKSKKDRNKNEWCIRILKNKNTEKKTIRRPMMKMKMTILTFRRWRPCSNNDDLLNSQKKVTTKSYLLLQTKFQNVLESE